MYKVTLSDGSVIDEIERNIDVLTVKGALSADSFVGKLGHVVITGDEPYEDERDIRGEHEHMVLTFVHDNGDGTTSFGLRDLTERELGMLRLSGDMEYLAMMTGIELEE